MFRYLLTFYILWFSLDVLVSPKTVTDPYQTLRVSCEKTKGEEWRSPERYRIIADLNNDTLEDIGISYSVSMFGNAGGHFFVFPKQKDGTYKNTGELFAHPSAISVQDINNERIIKIYSRSSSQGGKLLGYRITFDGIVPISKREIRPGDGGDDTDRLEYKSLFTGKNKLISARSVCKNGKMSWKQVR